MANSKQATKRARQIKKRTLHNASQHSEMRTAIKKTLSLTQKGERQTANKSFQKTASLIDKGIHRGIVHKNKAARLKRRLAKRLKKLATA